MIDLFVYYVLSKQSCELDRFLFEFIKNLQVLLRVLFDAVKIESSIEPI